MPKRIKPIEGQESVWDFPRPSIAQPVTNRLKVIFGGHVLAETVRGVRTIETSHPPTYYFPPEDVDVSLLVANTQHSFCEWKGQAAYFDIVSAQKRVEAAAWSYARPTEAFRSIQDYIAFYPGLMDACFVDGEMVIPQPGGFYGGWITSKFSGPFKGGAGTQGW
jgi:uncharacterized protein (DUF427 family)